MRIDVTLVDTVPRGVDTPADLETARQASGGSVKAFDRQHWRNA